MNEGRRDGIDRIWQQQGQYTRVDQTIRLFQYFRFISTSQQSNDFKLIAILCDDIGKLFFRYTEMSKCIKSTMNNKTNVFIKSEESTPSLTIPFERNSEPRLVQQTILHRVLHQSCRIQWSSNLSFNQSRKNKYENDNFVRMELRTRLSTSCITTPVLMSNLTLHFGSPKAVTG